MPNVGTTGWPPASGAANTGWGPQPTGMLMPGRIQGWPAGTQRAASSNAERLLATAVGWWDAAYYTAGDRFLRNRGVAGELLNLRLGSSLAANSNDPLYLAPEATGYCYLPGSATNSLGVPDENALDIVGDIDIRVRVNLESWSANSALVSKWTTTTQRSYLFMATTTGALSFRYTSDGSTQVTTTSTSVMPITSGESWVRLTFDVDNGATQNVATFYTSTDGVTWTQLGNPVTTAGVASIYSSTTAVRIMGTSDGQFPPSGRVYRAIVKDGIDGTTVLDIDCDALTSGAATSFTATTGQTVTINRSTSGRKTVAMPRGGRACFLLGTDDYMECQDNWQHALLNFAQGDSFTVLAVVRQWATPVSFARYIDKRGNSGTGYQLASNGTSAQVYARIDDTSTLAVVSGQAFTLGGTSVIGFLVDRAANRIQTTVNGSQSATVSTASVSGQLSRNPLTVGRTSSVAASYQDFEFRAAAVFRRPLSRDEISLLNTYFQAQGA